MCPKVVNERCPTTSNHKTLEASTLYRGLAILTLRKRDTGCFILIAFLLTFEPRHVISNNVAV